MPTHTAALSELFELALEELDITPTQEAEARQKYEAVGKWLSDDDSDLGKLEPEIYTQGSLALGTQPVPLHIQRVHLLKRFPESSCRIRSTRMTWRGDLQPDILCDRYLVELEYKLGRTRPTVRLIDPELVDKAGREQDEQPAATRFSSVLAGEDRSRRGHRGRSAAGH